MHVCSCTLHSGNISLTKGEHFYLVLTISVVCLRVTAGLGWGLGLEIGLGRVRFRVG